MDDIICKDRTNFLFKFLNPAPICDPVLALKSLQKHWITYE